MLPLLPLLPESIPSEKGYLHKKQAVVTYPNEESMNLLPYNKDFASNL